MISSSQKKKKKFFFSMNSPLKICFISFRKISQAAKNLNTSSMIDPVEIDAEDSSLTSGHSVGSEINHKIEK